MISKKIAKILEVAGVKCQIDINKDYGLLSEMEVQVIKRFCQEGITNALKHGKASQVKIKLNFHKEGNHVYCLNNGIKPKDLVKGNGLMGLDFRISQLGGGLAYVDKGEWFGLHMTY